MIAHPFAIATAERAAIKEALGTFLRLIKQLARTPKNWEALGQVRLELMRWRSSVEPRRGSRSFRNLPTLAFLLSVGDFQSKCMNTGSFEDTND